MGKSSEEVQAGGWAQKWAPVLVPIFIPLILWAVAWGKMVADVGELEKDVSTIAKDLKAIDKEIAREYRALREMIYDALAHLRVRRSGGPVRDRDRD